MLSAPIIHARTKLNDFPAGLLVMPEDFTPQDAKWARACISQSTRFLEMCGTKGRRVIFSNQAVVVTGLSIRIGDLYTLCGKQPRYDTVDRTRINYAFIGLVIPKSQITAPFDVPYHIFLAQYEAYMQQLWDLPYHDTGITAVKSVYTHFPLPQNVSICDIPDITNEKTRIVLDMSYAPLAEICAKVTLIARDQPEFAFCSDIPNAASVIESDFSIVTAKNAQQIIAVLEQKAEKDVVQQAQNTDKFRPFIKPFLKISSDKKQETLDWVKSGIAKTWKAIPKAVKIGGLLVIALSSVASKKKN